MEILAGAVAVIFVFSPHEFAHAFVAYKCGDATAKFEGRMTLNPIKHLDPIGYILCVFVGFGWAKPVPINPLNFKNYRKGLFLTSIAGVVANYIIALFAYLVFMLFVKIPPVSGALVYFIDFLRNVFGKIFLFSLGVFVFNLLPFSPLDGFRVVQSLTREVNPVRRFLQQYGYYILVALVLESYLCDIISSYVASNIVKYFDILGYVQWFAKNILGYPIIALWRAVFGLPLPIISPY